jgi:hypothetical protein
MDGWTPQIMSYFHSRQVKGSPAGGKARRKKSTASACEGGYVAGPGSRDNWTKPSRTYGEVEQGDRANKSTCEPIAPTAPNARIEKGPYLDPKRVYSDRRPPIPSKPLCKAASVIYAEYLRRSAFLDAIEDGLPVEFAGKTFLSVKKTRAHEILGEMPHGVRWWLVQKYLAGMADRSIPDSRAVSKSALADRLYEALAGGKPVFDELLFAGDPSKKIDVVDYLGQFNVVEKQAVQYGIVSRACFEGDE